jgi:hypothetical protein
MNDVLCMGSWTGAYLYEAAARREVLSRLFNFMDMFVASFLLLLMAPVTVESIYFV